MGNSTFKVFEDCCKPDVEKDERGNPQPPSPNIKAPNQAPNSQHRKNLFAPPFNSNQQQYYNPGHNSSNSKGVYQPPSTNLPAPYPVDQQFNWNTLNPDCHRSCSQNSASTNNTSDNRVNFPGQANYEMRPQDGWPHLQPETYQRDHHDQPHSLNPPPQAPQVIQTPAPSYSGSPVHQSSNAICQKNSHPVYQNQGRTILPTTQPEHQPRQRTLSGYLSIPATMSPQLPPVNSPTPPTPSLARRTIFPQSNQNPSTIQHQGVHHPSQDSYRGHSYQTNQNSPTVPRPVQKPQNYSIETNPQILTPEPVTSYHVVVPYSQPSALQAPPQRKRAPKGHNQKVVMFFYFLGCILAEIERVLNILEEGTGKEKRSKYHRYIQTHGQSLQFILDNLSGYMNSLYLAANDIARNKVDYTMPDLTGLIEEWIHSLSILKKSIESGQYQKKSPEKTDVAIEVLDWLLKVLEAKNYQEMPNELAYRVLDLDESSISSQLGQSQIHNKLKINARAQNLAVELNRQLANLDEEDPDNIKFSEIPYLQVRSLMEI